MSVLVRYLSVLLVTDLKYKYKYKKIQIHKNATMQLSMSNGKICHSFEGYKGL